MSDFLFSTRRRPEGELRRELERFLAPVTSDFAEHHGPWGSLAVARAPFDREVAAEHDGWISVLAGDPLVRAPDGWGFGVDGPRRRAVHRLLVSADPVAWDRHLDGQWAALAVDTRTGAGRIVTDPWAFVPLFHAMEGDGDDAALVIGTHVDAVARAAGRGRDVDPVSAADFAANLTCTHPHTLYRGVWQADAASSRGFGPRGWAADARAYWEPREGTEPRTIDEAAAALRDGFAAGVRAACAGIPEVGILLSGGEDSRAVLGAVPEGTRARGFVYADWESREVRVARAAAKAYGADLTVGLREPDHYLDGFEAVASLVGSHHLFMDVHGWGLHERLGLGTLPVVLGGLSSDSLLKAHHAPKEATRGPLPVPAVPGVRPELLAEVAARRTRFRDRLAAIRPESADEWMSLWPFSMRKHGGNVDGNRRLFRAWEAYHTAAVLRIAAGVPRRWKEHRRLFVRAMRPFLAKSWLVPHSEYRFPYFGRAGNLVLLPALGVARAVRALGTGEIRARHRPWPRWSRVSGSALMAEKRRAYPIAESPLREIFDGAPEKAEEQVRGWYSLSQLLLLQITYLSIRAAEE